MLCATEFSVPQARKRIYIIDFTRYNNIIRQKEILRVGAVGLGRQGERIYSIKGQD